MFSECTVRRMGHAAGGAVGAICYRASSFILVGVIKPRRKRWAGHVVRMGDRTGAYRGLEGRIKGKRQHGRPRCREKDNIKMYLKKWGGQAWTGSNWLRIGTGGGLL